MFSRKSKKPDQNSSQIDSLIGAGVHITGEVRFKGGLRLEGLVEGHVANADGIPGNLVVGPLGVIEGDIRVTNLIVDGTVRGSIYAEKGVELGRTARVLGNIHYGALEMHSGAVFEGYMVSHQTPLLDCSDSSETVVCQLPVESAEHVEKQKPEEKPPAENA
jgi:cytoskeletal protein CcmA (bactofilin family)